MNDLDRYRSTGQALDLRQLLRREPIPTKIAFHNWEVRVIQTARVDRQATYEQVVPKTGARRPDLVVYGAHRSDHRLALQYRAVVACDNATLVSADPHDGVPTTRVSRPGRGAPGPWLDR